MCEALGALCSRFINQNVDTLEGTSGLNSSSEMEVDIDNSETEQQNTFQKFLPRLLKKLELTVSNKHGKEQTHLTEILSAVCLQAMLGSFMTNTVLNTFDKVLNSTNNWTQYRIARSASRFVDKFLFLLQQHLFLDEF